MTETRSTLFIGGARSGKSRLAQRAAESSGGELVFIATAQAFDDEMRDRIARHRSDRDARWRTVESPLDLPEAIVREASAGRTLLVDCLTLWASNTMLAGVDADAAGAELVAAIASSAGIIVLVTNEVGWGIVPDNALARQFRDVAGRLNQQVAAAVDDVRLVVAGIAMRLK
ncbi:MULTISPECIES: bifunctional adenosylcobinamide kinase/adenosylcobinamide-phosphate guanylyltransferase [Sphingosinicellaceae]|uniref:bifunctional adenosylcobinamide kinase/adenosylcobinamide-phosphate guanylyltransferase n=1 Tax=Sphingosinicellaceae TaxID=2820280 RepID=UPI001C1DD600|nr:MULTISPECIES: bifunctional adenosylcobinamide kinase/adenosylcobinamide-phosphate guanylyltransferase [Polymorphobacter]QYE35520.1 bifunctional adenosylcobinamide kinase/adenosylcobinamide-phosphate guanylyltransferase [Polymorphobacter sp. PAMC 29334]UAJ11166.1 bifunctional adenosylcobinamide kinase/adenosylcobinamide-phosphate guanylyltransferase [Polymorphobacter megasporae]